MTLRVAIVCPVFRRPGARGPHPLYRLRDENAGECRGVEGPLGFASYREAVEASRFLVPGLQLDKSLTE